MASNERHSNAACRMGTLARPALALKSGRARVPILRRSRSDLPQSLQEPDPFGVRHAQVHLLIADAQATRL